MQITRQEIPTQEVVPELTRDGFALNPYAAFSKVRLVNGGGFRRTGWLPEGPDMRDFTPGTEEIRALTEKIRVAPAAAPLTKVDLRKWCSPIDDQGNLGSCTAHAAVGIVEYFQNRAFGTYEEGSKLFVYKATRNLMGVVGDTGAWLRTTMAALVYCGVAPNRYWPYTDVHQPGPEGARTFDDEPRTFVYSVADNYEATRYFRHDSIGVAPPDVLASMKKYLGMYNIPSMLGFYGFRSFSNSDVVGGIPYPCPGEQAEWGHAIAVVGYDDSLKITNTISNAQTVGAFLIRNSWGTGWGDKGYGWLPYEYVLKGLALDVWSLLAANWVNAEPFDLRSVHA